VGPRHTVEVEDVVKECGSCNAKPCIMKLGLYEEVMFVGEGMEEAGANNKEIRFELYLLSISKEALQQTWFWQSQEATLLFDVRDP
jgi:hypothetical protein